MSREDDAAVDARSEPAASRTSAAPAAAEDAPAEGGAAEDAPPVRGGPAAAPGVGSRRPITRFAFLLVGLLVALYLGTLRPQEQHVRVVLGAGAPDVTAVDLQYVAGDGEVAREAHFAYPAGAAPRVVAHEPQLPNGEYRLQIEVDARDGRRGVQRQVTLGGGSTQVDVSGALAREH
ncbi:MAG: hypothetical protein KIS78_19525 [Labilithrix sp.]|nr:hypothetical protein [Labilithrix sp.]MCW5834602.1 hypothetical protein [Labilithrix sp.]